MNEWTVWLIRGKELEPVRYEHKSYYTARRQALALAELHSANFTEIDHTISVDASAYYKRKRK